MISVLMSVYNGEEFLNEAIDSILNQTYEDFEFIILDDGSSDNSLDIIKSYEDNRIRIHSSSINMGLVYQLNRGLALSKGKYIARMDADDISLPERFERQVAFLDNNPKIGVLGTSFQILDENDFLQPLVKLPTHNNFIKWHLCFRNCFAHPTMMMKRDVIVKAGGYDKEMQYAEDYDLWRRLSVITNLSNLDEVLVLYRIHKTNVSLIHIQMMHQKTIQIKSMMISEILKADISSEYIQRIDNKEFRSVEDVEFSTNLYCRLYQAFKLKNDLTRCEKYNIKKDLSLRLISLIRPWLGSYTTWSILGYAFLLNPLVIFRLIRFKWRFN